jgi:hypothetical protein
MSSKLENYYNYIVNDMLSKTRYEIHPGAVVIYFPWGFYELYQTDIPGFLSDVDTIEYDTMGTHIINYIAGNYGMHNEEIVEVLKRLLKIVYGNILKDLENV